MSSDTSSCSEEHDEPHDQPGDPRDRLAAYLETKANHGSFQCKSAFLAEELDIPAWEVTALMSEIDDSVPELHVEELTFSRSTTWKVTCKSP